MKTNTQNIARKLFLLFSIFFFLTGNAQAPNKFSFQAVVRNASNQLITNQSVGVKISLISVVMSSETAEFEETHTVTTNSNGLLSLKVGEGTLVSGDFTTAMSSGAYSKKIKCEIDPTGGTNYTIVSNEQLLSVPYALKANNSTYANNADFATNATNATTATTANSVAGIAGNAGYLPVFGASNSLSNSIISQSAGAGNIGINTTTPTAKFEIKNIDNTTKIFKLFSNDAVNTTIPNTLQLESLSTNNAIQFSNWDINKSAIVSNVWGDLSFYCHEGGVDISTNPLFKVSKYQIDLNTNFIKIGTYGTIIKAIQHFDNIVIGSSGVQKKIVHVNQAIGNVSNFNPYVTLKQEGSLSDVFSVSITNITNSGYDIVVYRIDGIGWAQNLKANVLVVD